jgi:hypothetical protein
VHNGVKETAAQAAGRRYEEKALVFLNAWGMNNGYTAVEKPWIKYIDMGKGLSYCQPDCLLIGDSTDNLIIVEVKVRHTRDAFTQLRKYRDLIEVIHPKYVISTLEMCRYFDGSEYNCPLLPDVRPHEFAAAAVVWEPRLWFPTIN